MSMSVIVGYMVDLCQKYDMLDPDWTTKLREQLIVETNQIVTDERLERALTIERSKAVTKAKLIAWTKYIDCLAAEDRKKYLEQLLGSGGLVPTGQDFIDTLSQWSLVKINNESRMIKTNPDGTLQLNESVVTCQTGYHIANAFCKGNCWQTCEVKMRERRQARLIVTDSDKQYLESKGIKVDRR